MAHLIDILLVSLILGAALVAVIRYFAGLARKPKGAPVSCGSCNSNCHPDIPENPTMGLLTRHK